MFHVAILAKTIKVSAVIQATIMEFEMGRPRTRATSTARCGRPCSSVSESASADFSSSLATTAS